MLVLSDRNGPEGFNPTLERQASQTITRNPNAYMLISSEPLELYNVAEEREKGPGDIECVYSLHR